MVGLLACSGCLSAAVWVWVGCCMMLHGDGFGFWLGVVGCFAGRWLGDVIGFVEFWCLWFGACGFTVYLFDLDWF